MNEGLDLIKRQQPEIIDGFPTGNIFIGVTKEELTELEKELKDYQEIREIAKRFNWDDFTSEIFNVETDKKYRDLFNGAIVYIQKDYRKARAFDIIKEKKVNVENFVHMCSKMSYEQYKFMWEEACFMGIKMTSKEFLTQEEFDLLKEALL